MVKLLIPTLTKGRNNRKVIKVDEQFRKINEHVSEKKMGDLQNKNI